MAKLVIVKLKGGPDDGVELGYHVPPPLPKTINYVGSIYTKKADTSDPVIYDFTGPAAGTGIGDAAMHKGWADVQRSINHKMPAALHQSRRLRKEALRALSRARRVKL